MPSPSLPLVPSRYWPVPKLKIPCLRRSRTPSSCSTCCRAPPEPRRTPGTPAPARRHGHPSALHDAHTHAVVTPPGPWLHHVPSSTPWTSQTASSRSSTWPVSPPFLPSFSLTALLPVASPHYPPMACPSSTLHPAHSAPLRGYKNPRPPPLLTTPAPRFSYTT